MTEPSTTTFTLEVRAFPGAADPGMLATEIAQVFAISEDAARQLVDSAPCIVKQGASADAARQIAQVLLDLGAELAIRNDLSGEEKIHHPTPPADSREPQVTSAPAPSIPASSGNILRSVPPSAKLPALEMCAACSRPVEKGVSCASCGWHNKDQKRYCRECKRPMVVASDTMKQRAYLVGWTGLALAGAATVGYLVGPLSGLAALAIFVAPVCLYDARSAALRCEPCKRTLELRSLRDTERKLARNYRTRGYLMGVFLVLLSVALAAPSVSALPEFYVESFGIAWRARLPFTHRDVQRVALSLTTEAGQGRILARRATNPRMPVHSFYIMHARLPEKDAKPIEDPSIDRWIGAAIEAVVAGSSKVEKSHIVTPAFGTAREAVFVTTQGGKTMRGRARAFLSEHDLVLVAFAAEGADAADKSAGVSFLDSIEAVTPTDPK